MEQWGSARIAKGLCRYCGKYPIADVETNKCLGCKSRPATIQVDADATMNTHERLDVAVAMQQQLESRLLSVMKPQLMTDQAIALERHAAQLVENARLIRLRLQQDTAIEADLRKQIATNKVEIAVLRYMIQQKIPVQRLRFVTDYLRRMIEAEKLSQKELPYNEDGMGI